MIKVINSFVWGLLVLGTMGFQLPPAEGGSSDQRALEILRAHQAVYDAMEDFRVQFVWEVDNLRSGIKREGEAMFKDGMYVIKLEGQEIYCDRVNQWVYTPDDYRVIVRDFDPAETMGVQALFDISRMAPDVRFEGEEFIHDQRCYRLSVFARQGIFRNKQVNLWIDSRDYLLKKASIIDESHVTSTYLFSNSQANLGLPLAAFRFDPNRHPGIMLVRD